MSKINKSGKPADPKAEPLNSPTSNPITGVAPVKASSIQKSTLDENETLNTKERELLAECETDINDNLQGTFVLGWRFEQIRELKLYRATHKQFDAYCNAKWDLSKTHANRLIKAYLCEKHLKSVKDVEVYVPTKESQVRYIADLKPEQQMEVASRVLTKVGDGEASAEDFSEAREELYPKPVREAKAPQTDNGVADSAKNDSKVVPVKFGPNLVPLSKLKERADEIYYIFTNPTKKQEALNLIGTLQRDLDLWADWQEQQLKEQEAA